MKYIGKRIVTSALTLLVVSCLAFFSFAVIPGDPAAAKLGTQATETKLTALRTEMGLDRPLLVRYGEWLKGAVTGNFGKSYSYSMPVSDMIGDKLPVTACLSLYAFVIMLILAILIGIYSARHKDKTIDRTLMIVNQIIMSVPPFFAGILVTLLFGIILHFFTPGSYVSYEVNLTSFLGYLFFPALSIALPKAAMGAKLLRSSILEEMKQDYVRTAYSRGNRTKDVFYKHILKNAAIPFVTFCGMALADMIAGSIIIEQVFSIPGLGRILFSSIQNRDYPVVEAVIMCIAFLVIAVNLIVDFVYSRLDPRITLE